MVLVGTLQTAATTTPCRGKAVESHKNTQRSHEAQFALPLPLSLSRMPPSAFPVDCCRFVAGAVGQGMCDRQFRGFGCGDCRMCWEASPLR